jgi:transposase
LNNASFFKDLGYIQADAYPGYDKLYASGAIIEVACFAHARRKFKDVAKSVKEPTLANQALDLIGDLYTIERQCKFMPSVQRYYYRRYFAKSILKKLHRWLRKHQRTTPPKTPLGIAIQYALNHWEALNNYLRDGILDIDNNQAERAIKPFVIGRKNFLFAGSHRGAEHAAVIYSLVESCKMLNINTFDYFKDVLQRLPSTLNKNIDTLFPCFWKPLT